MWRRRDEFPELHHRERVLAAWARIVEAVLADRGPVMWR